MRLCNLGQEKPTTPGALVFSGEEAQFTLNETDNEVATSKRCEVVHDTFQQPNWRFYGWRLFIPTTHVFDDSFEIVSQWHDWPDFDLGETFRSPPLHVEIQADKWWLSRIWDPNPLTVENKVGPGGGKVRVDLGLVKKGTWTKFIMKVYWTHKNDGVLALWMNDRLVYSFRGPTTYNDRIGPYFKAGIYKPDWKYHPELSSTSQRIIKLDSLKIGDENSSIAEVSS